MSRPGLMTYLFGNPLTVLVLFVFTAWLGWRWYLGAVSAFGPIVAGITAISALNARDRIGRYRDWKREWNAMGGEPPAAPLMARIRANPFLRFGIGLPIWAAFVYMAWNVHTPIGQLGAALFWAATFLMLGSAAYTRIRTHRATTAAKREKALRDQPVTLSLKLPQQSPSAAQAYAGLPGYCGALMQRHCAEAPGGIGPRTGYGKERRRRGR